MRMTNTERVTLHRHRKRLGLRSVTVIVSEQEMTREAKIIAAARLPGVTAESIKAAMKRGIVVMRVDPVIPRCKKCTLVVEAIGGTR
jgi:hypothetical protein